ncbi:MAG TPA: MBL fold metallo-hydrolase [Candidatus Binatus sp.]|jgi:glyoxylase-like metal-dependent hydrolase (beta-lactamase superfamily II)|nr:MBL fold metallo-hydrolase [Candidatus Binatus sp.]
MREIVQGIVTWESFSEPHGYDFNGYFLRHPGGNLCIDPVDPPEDVLALLGREGVARILITNRNHMRKAMVVREQSGAPVTIHPDDAAYARQQGATIDAELRPGERIGPLTVVGVPGKSPGEVALHWPERRLLVVGDAAIGNPPGRLSLLRERVMDDPPRLRRSLRALAELDPDVVLVGDGVSIVGGAGAQLRALVASFPD